MKRDLDMIRDILLIIEEYETYCTANIILSGLRKRGHNTQGDNQDDHNESRDTIHGKAIFRHHLEIMKEADLIDFDEISYYTGGYWAIHTMSLTWNGHEYLALVKDNGVWSKVKDKIGDKISSVSLKIVETVASNYVKGSLGL